MSAGYRPRYPVENPKPLEYPWTPVGGLDDPEVRVKEFECGCYKRIDGECILCVQHLSELNGQPGDPS